MQKFIFITISVCFILLFTGCSTPDERLFRKVDGVWEAKIFTVDNTDWLDGGTTLTLNKNKDFTFKHGTLNYEGVWRVSGGNIELIYKGNRGCLTSFFTQETYIVEEISSKEIRLNSNNNVLIIADKVD